MKTRKTFKVWTSKTGETRVYMVHPNLSYGAYAYYSKDIPPVEGTGRDFGVKIFNWGMVKDAILDNKRIWEKQGFHWHECIKFSDLVAFANHGTIPNPIMDDNHE